MYNSKKEVDNHVRQVFLKIHSEKDRALRGLTIAKLYFKIKEYATAQQHLCSYLSVREDNEQAHKMLGQCYQKLNQPAKALQSFQRSLQLNSKQPELLAEVCQLLVDDDQMSENKAKYWCELAESENVKNESVYALRLKLMNQSNVQASEIETILRKEISSRPNDVNPRVRLVRHLLDQKLILDAFKYVHEFEMQQNEAFSNNSEWYNILWLVLSKYEQLPDAKKDWNFWLLIALCLERLVFISFSTNEVGSGAVSNASITETANLLFRFDQYLNTIAQQREKFDVQKEMFELFFEHYGAQLLIHAVSLFFKRELLQKKNKWRETLQYTLPLLLLAYHVEPKENKEPWMKHCDENSIKLIQYWKREGSFRCAQAGRVLLSCISEDNKENNKIQINSFFGSQTGMLWSNSDELLAQIRQTCADKQWRRNIFAQLFCNNSDQRLKEQTSHLVKSASFAEPVYELPTLSVLEEYEETAQYLQPQSLRHMVYLHLNYESLTNVRAKYFSGLNFSTQNLSFCSAESLNQLDIDSYLYAAIIEAQRALEVNRELSENYNGQTNLNGLTRPRILPFVNVQANLCNDEQLNWWLIAYKVYKNLAKSDNSAQMRSDLQAGIEAVRGLNGPKMDMIIVFKLGKIFVERAKEVRKPVERNFLDVRSESIYVHGLKLLKLHHRGVLEPFRKIFKYPKSNSSAVEREINDIAEHAVLYLSERMLKKAQFEEFIEEMNGVPLPFATYKQAEAYRKLEEANTTPKSCKQRYSERAAECLQQTLTLLKSTKFDPNHPLNATIHNELKRVQKSSRKFNDEDGNDFSFLMDAGNANIGGVNNSSTYEDAETEFFSPSTVMSRSRRDVVASIIAAAQATPTTTHNSEMESLVKQIASTLSLVKEELISTISPEVVSMRQEITSLKDKVAQLEDAMTKKQQVISEPPSRDDGSNVLDDLYIIDDTFPNQLYSQQSATAQANALYGGNSAIVGGPITPTLPSFGGSGGSGLQQSQTRVQTPNALQMQHQAAAARIAAYNNSMFNPNYALNYYASPYMLAQQTAVAAAASNPLLAQRGQLGLPYIDPTAAVNFSVPQVAQSLFPAAAQVADVRSSNIYSLLNQPPGTLPTLSVPQNSTLNLGPLNNINTTASMASSTTTTSATVSTTGATGVTGAAATFNKALNNQPVEKGPPANVVITNSDPLPNPNNTVQQQNQTQTLSVTIPSHHIKPSLVPISSDQNELAAAEATTPISTTTTVASVFGGSVSSGFTGFAGMFNKDNSSSNATNNFISSFSFKPAVEQALAAANNAAANSAISKTESPIKTTTSTTVVAGTATATTTTTTTTSTLNNDSSSSELNKTFDSDNAEYDPRPDFQPIIPLPDEIEVRTGEEDEMVMFSEHGKLYRYMDKEWKERGIGTIKILKGKDGQSRILMRRDQTHKICANHKITMDIKLTPKPDGKGYTWAAPDFADGELRSEIFFLRFKLQETAQTFASAFEKAQKEDEALECEKEKNTNQPQQQQPFGLSKSNVTDFSTSTPTGKQDSNQTLTPVSLTKTITQQQQPFGLFGATAAASSSVTTTSTSSTSSPSIFAGINLTGNKTNNDTNAPTTSAPSPFANFTFGSVTTGAVTSTAPTSSITSFSNLFSKSTQPTVSPFSVANLNLQGFNTLSAGSDSSSPISAPTSARSTTTADTDRTATTTSTAGLNKSSASDTEDDYVPTAQFKPVIPLPELIEVSTGEENYTSLFEYRAKLLRYDKETREWKERGLGQIRLLQHKDDVDNVRIVMRRDQVHKLCCNQRLYKDIEFKYAKGSQIALQWVGQDFSEGELQTEMLTVRFKQPETCKEFLEAVTKAQAKMSNQALQIATQNDELQQKQEKTKLKSEQKTVTKTEPVKGFGDKFKPKAGSWTCNGCFNNNKADVLYCPSCETPKDDTVPKKENSSNATILSTNTKSTFSFGFNNANTTNASGGATSTGFTFGTTNLADAKPANSFGDKFKPKAGSWTCTSCYTSNTADKSRCVACEAPNDLADSKQEAAASNDGNKNILALSDPTQKFSFGFPVAGAATTQPAFGITTTSNLTSIEKSTFTFSMQSSAMTAPGAKASVTETKSNATSLPFGSAPFSLNKKEFTFSLTPRNTDSESAGDTATEADGGDADDSGLLHEEENNTYFTPVIPLPDKIDVKTGEEDEEIIYEHRAKLFRLTEGEWKERGIGNVKILRHKLTKRLRVVMRRDQVHKICLNHALNEDVVYMNKDEKSWLFVVNDFSEGDVRLEKLLLRFKTKDIAEDFMNAVKNALSGKLNGHVINNKSTADNSKQESITATTTITTERTDKDNEKKVEAKWSLIQPELKLPSSATSTATTATPASILANRSFSLKQSALNSTLTPELKSDSGEDKKPTATDVNKTTPTTTAATATSAFSFADAFKESENKMATKSGGNFFFGNSNTSSYGSSIFSGGGVASANQPVFDQTPSIFAATKNGSSDESSKSVFGNVASPFFGNASNTNTSTTTSIFGGSLANSSPLGTQSNIFGGNSNVTSTTSAPLFGATLTGLEGAQPNKNGSLFGVIGGVSTTTTASTAKASFNFADLSEKSGTVDFASIAASGNNNNKLGNQPAEKPGPGGFIGLTNQDAFSSFLKSKNNKSVSNTSASNDPNANDTDGNDGDSAANDENYDPYYEPIIALPQEITVSTGEEDEERLFSERATLFRYDATNKEWKERGVGDVKILKHKTQGRYRIILRREQVHKLVLNFAITSEFVFDTMKNNTKTLVFCGMNYAESSTGEYERLAVRFKKMDLTMAFSAVLQKSMEEIKKFNEAQPI